jgi:hypothetical protein
MAFEIQEISISMEAGDGTRPPARPDAGGSAPVDIEAIVALCMEALREELREQKRKDWKER